MSHHRFSFASLRTAAWSLAIALLLAACGSPLLDDPAPNRPHDPEALPPALEGAQHEAVAVPVDLAELGVQGHIDTSWSAADGYRVEVIGSGLGSKTSADYSATIAIPDPDQVVMIVAQVFLKGGVTGTTPYNDPNEVVVFTATETRSWPTDGLARVFPSEPIDDHTQLDVGSFYQGVFGPASEISVEIDGNDIGGRLTPRSFVVYVFYESDGGEISIGALPDYYVFGNNDKVDSALPEPEDSTSYPTATTTLPLPGDFAGGDLTVDFAISDVQVDERIVVLEAEAGGVMASATYTLPDDSFNPEGAPSEELLIATLVLPAVPAGTTEVVTRVHSPEGLPFGAFDDSVYWGGVNVTLLPGDTPPPPPPGGGEGCTPGYWKNHSEYAKGNQADAWIATGYDADDSYDTVFGITSSFGGTLHEAVTRGGGGEKALGRHAVAALLNAASTVDYLYTEAEVIAMVQLAYSSGEFEGIKNLFEEQNEMDCPLN